MKKFFFVAIAAFMATMMFAQSNTEMRIMKENTVLYSVRISDIDSIVFADVKLSIELNTNAATMVPAETLRLRAITNTGEVKTYVWESSNPNVATVSQNGVVTAMSYGEADITCSLEDDANVKAVCRITVENILQTLKFTRATITKPISIDSTTVYDITTNSKDKDGNVIVLKAYMASISVYLYSDGFYQNNDGLRVSENKNKAFTLYMPTHAYVIPANLNPDYFENPTDYATWTTGEGLYKTADTGEARTVKPGKISEDTYLEHMKAAFEHFNKYVTNQSLEEEYKKYWTERYTGAYDCIEGALLYQCGYDEETDTYYMYVNPSAIVTDLAVRLGEGGEDLKYMYSVVSYDITVKPIAGLYGLDVEQNAVSYEYTFKSDNILYEEPIHYTNLPSQDGE